MWFKHPAWIPVAWILSAINIGATWFAAQPGEAWHATIHAALGAGLAVGARILTERRRAELPSEDLRQALDQNEQFRQTVEGMQPRVQELEERLDFAERLLAKQQDPSRVDRPERGA